LPNEVRRIRKLSAPHLLAQSCGAVPKIGAPREQDIFENGAVLCFGAVAVLGGAPFQRFHDILRNVSNQQLGHYRPPCYHMIANLQAIQYRGVAQRP
jgi:hypothetical protein